VNGYGTTKVYEVYTDVNGKRVEVHYEVERDCRRVQV
jgi:hypothetical protein